MKKTTKNSKAPKRGRPSTADSGNIISDREEEVLIELKGGKQYKQIADCLVISIETVRKHATNAYRKLQVPNRYQAVIKYFG